jgi:hypothetical protein
MRWNGSPALCYRTVFVERKGDGRAGPAGREALAGQVGSVSGDEVVR